ncbi:MAG TPA: glycosyltransferase [Deltaproteobacteria bacterium]|nr:glycosyltransferase [Deltaproteobacteria bacterium]
MDYSVVLPVFDEKDNLEPLHAELTVVMEALKCSYEIIYVDDGSADGSLDVLRRLHDDDDRVRVISFRRNFGQTPAIAAGFDASKGDVVITLDADLQNDPADIPRLLEKMKEGHQVVSGWRRERKDTLLLRRLPSVIANALIRSATNVRVHDYGCMLKVYDGDIARGLRLYGEMHRFIPAMAWDLGASVGEVVVNHRPRVAGVSKYGLSRATRVVLDLLTVKFLSVFSTRPLHAFGLFGFALGVPGTLMLGWLGFDRLVFGVELAGRPIVMLAILLVVMGVQFVTMGLLAEMLARTYHESQSKPVYVVAVDLPAEQDSGEAGGSLTAVSGTAKA